MPDRVVTLDDIFKRNGKWVCTHCKRRWVSFQVTMNHRCVPVMARMYKERAKEVGRKLNGKDRKSREQMARDGAFVITTGEMQKITGISSVTLWRWAVTGKIESRCTPGGHVRFSHRQIGEMVGLYKGIWERQDLVERGVQRRLVGRELPVADCRQDGW